MDNMTLEEALAAADVSATPVNDILMVDAEDRTIIVPANEMLFGVRQDMDAERKHFKCPKIVGDNVDLSNCHIYISYVPSKQDGTYDINEDVGAYLCEDLDVDGDYVTFSWKLSGNVFVKAGYIAFAVYAKQADADGNLQTKWHTTFAIGKVLDTLPDGEQIVEKYADVIEQLLNRMDEVEAIATPEAMQGYVNEYLDENPPSGMTAEEKAQLQKNTEDISSLSEEIADLKENGTGGGSATVVSPLKGKYASFLGDSITTYQGYIPNGYDTYYTASNLASVDDTWWKKVIDATGMNLCVNESYSGTRVAVTSWLGDYAGCLPKRCMNLHTAEHIPDKIFVAIGCNDFNNEIEIGEYSASKGLNFDNTKFTDAYAQMLYYITTKYPMAKVYCCTCPTSEKNAPTTGAEVNGNGLAFYEFNDLIRKIARMFNCEIIDFESCGITHENLAYYMVDGIQHPNAYGHSLMANKAIETIDPSNPTRYANLEAVMKPSATGVSLDKTTLELEKGKTETLTATVVPSDAVIKSVKWSTSDETKATVSNGLVTAIGEGEVTITVTTDDGGYTAQCDVLVTASSVVDAQVTAITNTAGQYIDTGYVPTANTKFEMDWKLETFVAQMHVVGATGLAVKYGNSNSAVMCNRHSNQQSLTYIYDASTRSVIGLDGTTLYKDGTAVDTKSTYAVTMEQSLVLFGANGYGSAADLVNCTGTYTLYGFKIYESDELVKNFVPWVDADGKACLKEIIGGTYHYDATGGTFEYI